MIFDSVRIVVSVSQKSAVDVTLKKKVFKSQNKIEDLNIL